MSLPGAPLPAQSGGTEIDRIRATVSTYFPVYEARVTANSLILLVHAEPATLESRFDEMRRELWPKFYIPQIRHEGGEYLIEIVRRPNRRPFGLWVNLLLLAATVGSTVAAGGFLWLSYVGGSHLVASDFLWGGVFFGLPLLAILGFHELAHFVVARRHHVEASLPYFIPVPPPWLLFGTFGAFISLREPIPDKKALLDIGASGPLAGFAVAIPITIIGMALSAHAPSLSVANCGPTILGVNYGNLVIGLSLFWSFLGLFVPIGANLHPLALAGWVGLLVTAINLLPAGQLDGGHVFRALFGDRSKYVSWAAVVGLFGLGLFYSGWFVFGILVFVLGMRHPPPLNDITPLDPKRLAVGGFAVAILVTGFVIVPIAQPSGAFGLAGPGSSPLPNPNGMADNLTLTVVNHDVVGHGFLFSGAIQGVDVPAGGGGGAALTGSALAAFEANSTWVVFLPNGNVSTYQGGSWMVPSSAYSSVDAGASARLNVTFLNPTRAAVLISLGAQELCNSASAKPQSSDYQID
ncbi:MAG TPA: site-2 protease family protein [Thermoplasmata archaeon]|nr:site-2 protease family protein [Thermoplasmata archaeon]